MSFEPALWDDSDPLYAPCLSWGKKIYPRWRAPKRYIKAGYSVHSVRLEGTLGDGRDLERAARCRELTRDMVAWSKRQSGDEIAAGTWDWLIHRYRTDTYSPFRAVKPNTRDGYEYWLGHWQRGIGTARIADCNFERICIWREAMKENGRSTSHIKRMFTGLRILVNYGTALEHSHCQRISGILANMRFETPAARTVIATREHVEAVVAAADRSGAKAFAAGILLQFELALRAVDVRGQWLTLGKDEPHSGIVRGGKRWADGLTWAMVSEDCRVITKMISKTANSLPEPMSFDLTPLPELRARLIELRAARMTGPVIISERHQMPFRKDAWGRAWRRFAKEAGVPDIVRCMDLRAGAISEAQLAGAEGITLRDAAQHKDGATTGRYARTRSENAGKVIQLRAARKQG